jgi:hypothetical protein
MGHILTYADVMATTRAPRVRRPRTIAPMAPRPIRKSSYTPLSILLSYLSLVPPRSGSAELNSNYR